MQVTERGHDGAGQRGDVDHVGRAQRAGVVQAVRQHQPALGVGVVDLDRLAVRGPDDVIGLEGGLADHVLGRADHRHDLDRKAKLGDGTRRLEHRRRARHVELHPDQAARRLQRVPARVVREPLADQTEHDAGPRPARLVAKDDRERRLRRPLRHGEEQPHPAPLHPGPVVDARGERGVLLGQLAGAIGQLLRPHVPRRRVLEVAGPVGRLGEDGREPGLGPVAAQHGERGHLARPVVGRPGQVAGEAVAGERGPVDDAPRRLGRLERHAVERERDRLRPCAPCRANRGRGGQPDLGRPGRLPEPHDRDPLGPHAAVGVHHRHLPSRAADLARVDEPGQRAPERPVDGRRGAGQAGRSPDRDREHVGCGALGRGGRGGDSHAGLRWGKMGRPILRSRHGRQDHAPRERPSPKLVQHPRRRAHAAAAAAAPGHRAAGRARRSGAALPDGPDPPGGLDRLRDRDPRGGARRPAALAADAASPRAPARARHRHPLAHLLQVRGRLAGRLAQAQHRGRPGVLLRQGRPAPARHRDRGGPVGERARAGVAGLRARVQGLHGARQLRPEALPAGDDGDVGRDGRPQPVARYQRRPRRSSSRTPTRRAASGSRSRRRSRTPPGATTRATRSAPS